MENCRTGARILHQITARALESCHSIPARPLAAADDCEIDAALELVGLSRTDLFTPVNAIRHRVHMAYMLAVRHIDVVQAVASHWQQLKVADETCLRCPNPGSCRRWLEWAGPEEEAAVFCPNADLFDAIVAVQTQGPGLGERYARKLVTGGVGGSKDVDRPGSVQTSCEPRPASQRSVRR
jgi:hypothetical protein